MIELSKTARKITWILFADQSLASAGYLRLPPSIRLLGPSLAEAPRSQVCPPAVYQVGAAFAASAWGYIMDRIGEGTEWSPGS